MVDADVGPDPPTENPVRLLTTLHRVLGVASASALFTVSFAGAVVAHGDLPVTRRVVADLTTRALATTFAGKLVIRSVDHLGFDSIDVGEAEMFDASGRRVVRATGVHARVRVVEVLRTLLSAPSSLRVRVDEVDVDDVEVLVEAGPSGVPRVAEAFQPRPKPPPKKPPKPKPPTPFAIELPKLFASRARAVGMVVPGLDVDAMGSRVAAALAVTSAAGVTLDVERFGVVAKVLSPVDPNGTVDYHLRVPLAAGSQPRMWSSFAGRVGAAPVNVRFDLAGSELDATVESARVTPDALRSLAPSAPLEEPFSLKVRAKGPLRDLGIEARAVAGPGEVRATGRLSTDGGLRLVTDVSVRDLDPRAFSASSPPMSVGGDANVTVLVESSGVRVDVDALSFPFSINEQVVPSARVFATWAKGTVTGRATVYEPGATVDARYTVDPKARVATVDADVAVSSLAALPRFRGAAEGSLSGKVAARVDPNGFEAKVTADVHGVGKGTTKLARGTLRGRVAGPFAKPYLDATLDGGVATLAGFPIERARVRLVGSPRAPHAEITLSDPRWSELKVDGDLRARGGVQVSNLRATLAKGGVRSNVTIAGIDASPARVVLRDVKLEGEAGKASGDLAVSGGGVSGAFRGTIDLARLSRVVPSLGVSAGTATFDATLSGDGEQRTGDAHVRVEGVEALLVPFKISGDARASLRGTAASVELTGAVGSGSSGAMVELVAKGTAALNGSLLADKTYADATGEIVVEKLRVDVGRVLGDSLVDAAVSTLAVRPRATGDVLLRGKVTRSRAGAAPEAELAVSTRELDFSLERRGGAKLGEWRGYGLDVAVVARAQAGSAEQREVAVTARLHDRQELLSAFARTELPLSKTIADARLALGPPSPARDAARQRLAALPLAGRVGLDERAVDTWPELLRVPNLKGTFSASAVLGGTLGEPIGGLTAQGKGLEVQVAGLEPWPVELTAAARFDGKESAAWVDVHHAASRVLSAQVSSSFRVVDAALGRGGNEKWTMSTLVQASGLQLGAVPLLAAAGIDGVVTGTVSAKGIHGTPEVDVDIQLADGHVASAAIERARLAGRLTTGASAITLTLDQSRASDGGPDGQAQLTAFPSLWFHQGIFPRFDHDKPQTVAARFRAFDIEPAAPFTAPILADLRGRLDGELTLTVTDKPVPGSARTRLWGSLSLSDAVVLVPQIGQTFTDGRMSLSTEEQGKKTHVLVKDFSFAATSGRVDGAGRFVLEAEGIAGLIFGRDDVKPATVSGELVGRVSDRAKIPVTFEGVPLGDAYGTARASVSAQRGRVDIGVALPDLVFELPESEAHGIQRLADEPEIGVVDKRYREAKRKRADDATQIEVKIGLGMTLEELHEGKSIGTGRVVVRRGGLDVSLAGAPVVTVSDAVRMTGTVETLSGRVIALGKPFNVDRGFVRFDGEEIDNPYLGLRATWDAPDGTRIAANVDGYFKEPRLRFRSDPPRAESEIFGLLLFGRTTGTAGATQTGDQGVAVGSGVASNVLNSLLDPVEVFGRKIETRVDNTTTRGTAVGVATEIRPRLWAQVDVSTAQQRDRQNADLSALTLDWRFRPNWALRTSVGDRGSSQLELLWQYRY